jgi:alpha-tubulin suppressor-like RCC1 family protein
VYRSSPVQVLGGLSFAQLSAGFERTCGVTTSGSAYCWGYNGGANTGWGIDDYGDPPGILGVGSLATFVAQPARVTGATQWAEVSANFRFACGRTTAGTLFCWGANTVQSAGGGQLGNGTMVTSTQPVPTSTGALSFTRVAAGNHSACALSAAGEAWCWGVSINGEVGDGGPVGVATSYPTPIKVVGGHIFTTLSVGFQMACGITAAGETWCWGANFRGNLGDGTTISRSTPVKIVP